MAPWDSVNIELLLSSNYLAKISLVTAAHVSWPLKSWHVAMILIRTVVSGIPKKTPESKWVSSVQIKIKSFQVANKFKFEDLLRANEEERLKKA